MHDYLYFFHHSHNVESGTYRIFEPQWKAEILHWFGREDVAISQKEEALKATDRERAIAAFAQIVHTTESRSTLRHAALRLGRIAPGNKTAIAALVLLIQVTQDETMLRKAACSLGEIGTGDASAVAALVQLLQKRENQSTYEVAALSAALVQLLGTTQSEYILIARLRA